MNKYVFEVSVLASGMGVKKPQKEEQIDVFGVKWLYI